MAENKTDEKREMTSKIQNVQYRITRAEKELSKAQKELSEAKEELERLKKKDDRLFLDESIGLRCFVSIGCPQIELIDPLNENMALDYDYFVHCHRYTRKWVAPRAIANNGRNFELLKTKFEELKPGDWFVSGGKKPNQETVYLKIRERYCVYFGGTSGPASTVYVIPFLGDSTVYKIVYVGDE